MSYDVWLKFYTSVLHVLPLHCIACMYVVCQSGVNFVCVRERIIVLSSAKYNSVTISLPARGSKFWQCALFLCPWFGFGVVVELGTSSLVSWVVAVAVAAYVVAPVGD